MKSLPRSTRRRFLYCLPASVAVVGASRIAGSYAEAVLRKNPAGYWRLGEKRGTEAADAGGHGHRGVYRGKPVFGERGAIRGDPDTAIRVAPPDTYVEIPNSGDFSQSTSGHGLTVEAWMRPYVLVFPGESIDPYVNWLGKGERDEMEWGLRLYSAGSARPNRISAYVWNAEGGLGAGAYFQDSLTPGQWIHIVASFAPGTENTPGAGVSLYKDGQLRGSPATQKGALYSSYNVRPRKGPAPVRLGTRDFGSFLTGALDEVAIYPRQLTAAEVREHYQLGTGKA